MAGRHTRCWGGDGAARAHAQLLRLGRDGHALTCGPAPPRPLPGPLPQGHDWEACWGRIQQLIIKSLCSVQPVLRNNYRSVLPPDNDGFSCFEILG
jgi:hypothetical protein